MVTMEPELRCPAPRPTRLRAGARFRFAVLLSLFVLLGGAPLLLVMREIRAFQMLQQEGLPVEGTVRRRVDEALFPGVRIYALNCVYTGPSGKREAAALAVDRKWWLASPPGSKVVMTTCEGVPGYAALGEPSDLQLSEELGLPGSGLLLIGLTALLIFGSRLRPYFRDIALVSLGTPVSGRVVGKTWKVVRRLGRTVTLPMIHLHFRDPFGVERVRTQVVDRGTWARTVEDANMTVLVCARRRGWFAAYPLLLAEAVPPHGKCAAALQSKPML
jgi:hypothetical protein